MHQGPDVGQVLDELTAHVNDAVESALEIDYRAAVINLVTSADDRTQLEAATDQLAVAIADHRRDADALVNHCQRVGAVLQVPEPQRSLALVTERAPEPWRSRLSDAIGRLETAAMTGRRQLRRADIAARANEHLIEASIDAAITEVDGHSGEAKTVTYGAENSGSRRARFVDGRA